MTDSPLNRRLFVYRDGAVVQTLEISPGRHYLGSRPDGTIALAPTADDLAVATGRIELLKDGSASIRQRSADIPLAVNNRLMREAPLTDGDEIMLGDYVMLWNEEHEVKGYVFASQKHTPVIIVEDGATRTAKVTATIQQEEWTDLTTPHSPGDTQAYSIEKLNRQMSSLLVVSQEINGITDPNALFERIIDYLFNVLLIDRGAILMPKPEKSDGVKNELEVRRVAYRRQAPPESIRLPSSITRRAIEEQAAILVSNPLDDPRFQTKPSIVASEICSAMAVPLMYHDDLMGLLYVDTNNPAVSFSAEDLKFFAVFANLTTVAMRNARKFDTLKRRTDALEEANAQAHGEFVIGESKASQQLETMLKRLGKSSVTVLLTGESGTGKEVAARRLHDYSPRANEPFVAINCAAVPENLIESELFGYEKGAFTGAQNAKAGRFEMADGGTLLLDEIGEIPAAFQAKLLRVLEGHGFERVGGTETIRPNVRLVAATNRDLRAAADAGEFRGDLFYRLSVFPLHLHPLRERRKDIINLASFFIQRYCGEMNTPPIRLTPEAQEMLQSYDWPGNVRELRNVIERLIILSEGGEADESILRESLQLGNRPGGMPPPPPSSTDGALNTFADSDSGLENDGSNKLKEREIEAIREALDAAGGNKAKAARILGVARHQLLYRLKKYGIEG